MKNDILDKNKKAGGLFCFYSITVLRDPCVKQCPGHPEVPSPAHPPPAGKLPIRHPSPISIYKNPEVGQHSVDETVGGGKGTLVS